MGSRVARQSEATVHVVYLAAELLTSGGTSSEAAGQVSPFLRDLTEETGGSLWRAAGSAEFRDRFLEILDQVKRGYVLRFEPRGVARPGWHEIEVRLKGRRGKVRARRGYFRASSPDR